MLGNQINAFLLQGLPKIMSSDTGKFSTNVLRAFTKCLARSKPSERGNLSLSFSPFRVTNFLLEVAVIVWLNCRIAGSVRPPTSVHRKGPRPQETAAQRHADGELQSGAGGTLGQAGRRRPVLKAGPVSR